MWMTFALAAAALTTDRNGLSLDVGAGGGHEANRWAAAAQLDLHAWWGRYDADFVLGRSLALGVVGNIATAGDAPTVRTMLSLRRGVDLVVAGWHGGLAAGPLFTPDGLGLGARAGAGLTWRASKLAGLGLSIDGGVDVIGESLHPAGGLRLHGRFGGPTDSP